MRENCFYCYYHSRCAFLLDENEWGVCEHWSPANIPIRAVEHFEREFREKALQTIQHIYNDNQRIMIMRYLDMRADSLHEFLSYSLSHEVPTAPYRNNSNYHEYVKNNRR